MEYGLIGKPLAHSFSKQIHEALTDYIYTLHELADEAAVAAFLHARDFKGMNVTIPYKQTVLPLCDVLDESARVIGAVNTIVNRNGVLTGYNTDFAGCRRALHKAGIVLAGKNVLILGSGGTQKTFLAVAHAEGAKSVLCASRTAHACETSSVGTAAEAALPFMRKAADIMWTTYAALSQHPEVEVVLNATPVGMYPHAGTCLVDFDELPNVEAVFDAVYNPLETELLRRARALNRAGRVCKAANGLGMLVGQAKYAIEYFLNEKIQIEDTEIDHVTAQLRARLGNLVLIGMPGSGKSTLGCAVADLLGKRFVDLDTEVEHRAGKEIPAIFLQDGESAFRALETEICAKWGEKTDCVLATGGGAVLREKNVRALRQNGTLIYVKRAPHCLARQGRPLSNGAEEVAALYKQRAPLYEAAADKTIDNSGAFDDAVQAILEAYDAAETIGD